jgi:glycosyltransferase involved in cell wall biosynthesis
MGELVEDEVNGRLIPPEDAFSWADALEILLYSPNQRRTMGDAARTRVARDRTWAHIAERTREAYRHLGAV